MDMRETLREKIAHELEQRGEAQAAMDELLDGVATREADDLTTEEDDLFGQHAQRIRDIDTNLASLQERMDQLDDLERSRSEAERVAERFGGTKATQVRVNRDEPIYRQGGQHSFFTDAWRAQHGDPDAKERQIRNAQQVLEDRAADGLEFRDASTTSFAGMVVPQYLTDRFAELARAGRPFLNAVQGVALPADGMTLSIPMVTTQGTLVRQQTSQNSAVDEQDIIATDLSVPVVTIAGQQDVSRQALDRGTNVDQIVMSDLARAYMANHDLQAIQGTGASGTHYGVLSTTGIGLVTVTSTAAATQLRAIADAVQQVHSEVFLAPNLIVMHPRRWAYLCAATDTTNRPLITNYGIQNAFGAGDLSADEGVVGTLYGLPVLTDPNVPTTVSTTTTQGSTEDRVIVCRSDLILNFEESETPNRVRFEETIAGSLTVKIVAWGYSAFTAGRYPAASHVLVGSGLTTPTFT